MVLDKTINTNKIIITKEDNYESYSFHVSNDYTKESTVIELINLSLNDRYYEFNITESDIENIAIGKLNYSLFGDDVLIKSGVVTVKGAALIVQAIATEQPQFQTLKYAE